MEFIRIGKVVGTHGIKGEIRINSTFQYKDKVFIKDFPLYIGKDYKKEIISTYRKHKNYDMVTFVGYNNINQVLDMKNEIVYINKQDLELKSDEILDDDLIGIDAYVKDTLIGKVKDIYFTGNNYKVFEIMGDKKILIPYHKDFIERIDLDNKKIIFNRAG